MVTMRKIERFLRVQNMAPTTFGRLAVGDPRLVHDMRRGREVRVSMSRRVDTFMSDYAQNSEQPKTGASQ